ncbi:hypothetical protein MNBD_GAMMA24-1460 [hydrothermal vent metagenome]|uniref:DUF6316 domain-containing protein n=1 Tax=hydrothermal vent metagenome TaxID=652676 RepID=A0A3B1CAX1_9ZZZZ
MNKHVTEPLNQNRYGEQGNIPARKKRIYSLNNEWYFLTREYGVFGPYSSLVKAQQELKLYMRRLGIVRTAIS